MSEVFAGGCQCGAVRYELLERPTGAHICHCRMCQKQFGNFFAALVGVPKPKFRVTRGQMTHFRSSEDVQRGFCRDCGTPLTYEPLKRDGMGISIGSLDRHSEFKPEVQYGTEAREPWFDELHKLPAFPSGEDETGSTAFTQLLPAIKASNRQHPDYDTDIWLEEKHDWEA
ncbi:GFA family protein [Aestuariivirga litoralis]|uniref:GFA family protein n=1 Tax=Aestuariivirga litoralis TaxID=2650924 RepID=UPI0018C52E65|nr:GFA family protein [Aestuariivirga litoralis]MBG1232050.1 GFA family protein [Aestuariivirga litoralis]